MFIGGWQKGFGEGLRKGLLPIGCVCPNIEEPMDCGKLNWVPIGPNPTLGSKIPILAATFDTGGGEGSERCEEAGTWLAV